MDQIKAGMNGYYDTGSAEDATMNPLRVQRVRDDGWVEVLMTNSNAEVHVSPGNVKHIHAPAKIEQEGQEYLRQPDGVGGYSVVPLKWLSGHDLLAKRALNLDATGK